MEHKISPKDISGFCDHLRREERAENTVAKYIRDITRFYAWIGGSPVTKEAVVAWKEHMCGRGAAAVSVNASLAALHSFFTFMNWQDCRVKYLKRQRRVFRDNSKELTKAEYQKLVLAAEKKGNRRLSLLVETLCATGIRVSEVKYITLEAVTRERADIALKGKLRTVLIPGKLARKLKKFAQKQKIAFGEIFITKSGKSLSRGQIWSEMKSLCQIAGIAKEKAFPHNLRHLFARVYYSATGDIVRLADVLGHSSIETTRIYLVTTGKEHAMQLERLGLVS